MESLQYCTCMPFLISNALKDIMSDTWVLLKIISCYFEILCFN